MGRKKKTVKALETIWVVPDELWAKIESILLEDASAPDGEGRASGRLASGVQRVHLPHEVRLPVEPSPQGVRRRQLGSPLVPSLEQERRYGEDLGLAGLRMRRTRGRQMGVAECRRGHGQGSVWW